MKTLAASLLLLAATAGAPPARADEYRTDGRYDPHVPAPAAVLGFELGDRPARHEAMLRYAGALAAASPRVRLERYAQSHGGRDLVLLVISSEANLTRLDSILDATSELADPRRSLPAGRADRLLADTPVIAYLAYGIHGDELSSTDAALRVAYELAAGETDDVHQLLDRLVVLIDPAENPDGRERVLGMSDAFQGGIANADPDALSHSGVWPWGRGNHYLFDLNRDWFALVHPESQGRAAILRRFRPQLVVDSHEMGSESTYLFSPPRAPFNPNLPTSSQSWWDRFATDQAHAFDAHGWSYYTREWNEEFFPGYGSSVPLYQGAVGILYEQAGSDGQEIRRVGGGTLRFKDAVARHFVSSLANLRTAAGEREKLLRSWREARAEAVRRGAAGPARAWYFEPHPDPARAGRLASHLAALGIEVERLRQGGPLPGARSPWKDGPVNVTLLPGSFRVRLDQPDGLLARAVLEPHTPMPDSFLAEEREHLERQKGSRIYDVTAWSPLLAAGISAWWTPALDGLSWEKVERVEAPAGNVVDGPATYGWIFDGASDGALRLAARLAALGVKVRVGEKPFTALGQTFPRGSFLVRTEENPEKARFLLLKQAPVCGVEVLPVAGARIASGPDLGGDYWTLVEPARIAIAAGSPTSFTSVGWAWHLLDRELELRVSLVDVTRLASIDLDRYNVLVLPHAGGGGSAYRRALGDEGLKAVRAWVERGGTLVGIGSGSDFLADQDTKLSQVKLRRQALKDFAAPRFGLDDVAARAIERLQATGLGGDGKPIRSAGLYSEESWPESLAIPGRGSPVLGPGTWALLGAAGEAARARAPLRPAGPASAAGGRKDKPGAGSGKDDKTAGGGDGKSEPEQEAARKKADERLRRFLPGGAVLRVDLDPEQWLAWGAGERVAVMASAEDALLARDPVVTAGRFAAPEALHLGGLLWPEAAGRIAQTAFLTRETQGRGQVVLFSDDPNFRGYFWGSERLFLNAVLLGPALGVERRVPW